ncbi:MAG TPA: PQQ-binding-like beta-propeller repeat protein [Phycisphaerae bacterium]|nr:PQQ-binding-like beta-propeller repeat protein [Phycisphaerae bacterium]
MRKIAVISLSVSMVALAALGADWPQYGGPNRDNTSAETGLARTWPAGGPKVLWQVKVGQGYGGACVQGGKVYMLDRPDARQEMVRCLDFQTGKEEWSFAYPAARRVSHPGSRSTPAADGKHVVTVGFLGDVHCFDKATHKVLWTKNLLKDYGGGRLPMWAISQSALLYKDILILAPQGSEAGIVALETATGKELWRSKSVGDPHYVSPRIVTIGGTDQVVIVNGNGISAVSAADGKVLWNYPRFQCKITIPNVTPLGDGRVFMTAGYDAGSVMLMVAKSAAGFTVEELFKSDECNSQMSPALYLNGYLYANSNSNSDSDGMVCVDAKDGKVVWKTEREHNFQRGHFLFADGMIYIIDGKAGSLHLLEPSPKGLKELAKVSGLLGGPEIWAPLALSDGKLIIRDQSKMLCLDVTGK